MKPISLSLILLTTVLSPTFSAQADGFKPPQTGTPESRVGGGTRSITDILKQIEPQTTEQIKLLASNQTGLSSSAAPTLYWYTASVPSQPLEITVQSINEVKPLLKKNIGIIRAAGIQTIRLADYGVKLEKGKNYTWSVSPPINNSAQAAFASASIRHETPKEPLTDLKQMTAAGYWYDAVKQLVESKSPQLSSFLQKEGISIPTDK
jgi:hypothetical protein